MQSMMVGVLSRWLSRSEVAERPGSTAVVEVLK